MPIRGVSSLIAPSGIAKIIKLRTVSRATQPSLGKINTFIGNSAGTISSSVGLEVRNETTSSFMVGGQKEMVYQIEQDTTVNPTDSDGNLIGDYLGYPDEADDIIAPYFGKDNQFYGNALLVEKDDNGRYFFYAPLDPLNEALVPFDPTGAGVATLGPLVGETSASLAYDYVRLTEFELRTASEGFDQWYMYTMSKHFDGPNAGQFRTHLGRILDATGKLVVTNDMISRITQMFKDFATNNVAGIENFVRDFIAVAKAFTEFRRHGEGATLFEQLMIVIIG